MTIGLFTDLHYAFWEPNPEGNRYYRQGIDKLRSCIDTFNARQVDLAVFLGDIVDFRSGEDGEKLLEDIAEVFRLAKFPIYMLPGNHDTDHFMRAHLKTSLGVVSIGSASPTIQGCKLILLDSCCDAQGNLVEAQPHAWEDFYIGPAQLHWLKEELAAAEGQPKLVLSHVLLGMSRDMPHERHLARNNEEARAVIAASDARFVIQGHYHWSDYVKLGRTHYITLKGMTCSPFPLGAYYICDYTGTECTLERFACTDDFMGEQSTMVFR